MPHTPGPWTFDPEDVGGSILIHPAGSYLEPWIADVKCEHVGPKSRDEINANAQLIVTAPDLLAALKLILPLAKGYAPAGQSDQARRTCNEWIAAAVAAVERAEGNGA